MTTITNSRLMFNPDQQFEIGKWVFNTILAAFLVWAGWVTNQVVDTTYHAKDTDAQVKVLQKQNDLAVDQLNRIENRTMRIEQILIDRATVGTR